MIKKIHFDKEKDIVKISPKRKPRRSKKLFPVFLCLIVIFIFSLFWFTSTKSSVFNFVLASQSKVQTTNDRVNILLLGNGGGMHDGPELTDSIIVASYNLKTKHATLFSIPRDLWLSNINEKINAAYVVGNKNGKGLVFAEDKIDDILGIPIHYGVRLDFDGFEDAIDTVGGIDVVVEKTFDDYNYPAQGKENDPCGLVEKEVEVDAGSAVVLNIPPGKRKVWVRSDDTIATQSADFACRFEHIHFDRGATHLNGEQALKYVRSRHGTNGEGSDFARSKRQHQVITAFREKALSLPTLSNPQKVIDLLKTFKNSIETDIPVEAMIEFYGFTKDMKNVESVVLGDLGNGKSILYTPPMGDYGGAWVLMPEDNDYLKIGSFVNQKLVEADIAANPEQK